MLSVKQGGIKYHFKVFGMTRPRIEPRSPGPLANTLSIMPMSVTVAMKKEAFRSSLTTVTNFSILYIYIYIYIYQLKSLAVCLYIYIVVKGSLFH